MADIEFVIETRTGKQAAGTLKWAAKSLSASAVTGPFGNGALPTGSYSAPRAKLLDKPAKSSYCDSKDRCWMQVLEPQFATTRTDLGIHPDGGVAGTEGCIGLTQADTKAWYDAFYAVSGSVTVEVKEGSKLFVAAETLRRPERIIVGVIGSATKEWEEHAVGLGEWIARQGFDLLTGGGPGVMAAVCRGFSGVPDRRGVSFGIIPGRVEESPKGTKQATCKKGYPNPWVDIPIYTHLPGDDPLSAESRNHINVLTATLLIALPGGTGTHAEAKLALAYGRKVVALGQPESWDRPLPAGVPILADLPAVAEYVSTFVTH
ncbi:MAG TPA: hypothetical protein VF584_11660 [Longimicrobium sp.]|jgi:uncharacterized protein (TIGR00725 family)